MLPHFETPEWFLGERSTYSLPLHQPQDFYLFVARSCVEEGKWKRAEYVYSISDRGVRDKNASSLGKSALHTTTYQTHEKLWAVWDWIAYF